MCLFPVEIGKDCFDYVGLRRLPGLGAGCVHGEPIDCEVKSYWGLQTMKGNC